MSSSVAARSLARALCSRRSLQALLRQTRTRDLSRRCESEQHVCCQHWLYTEPMPAPFGTSQRQLRTSTAHWEKLKVVVPSMGDSISEGTIVTIQKKPGDPVKQDEVIMQIETDKVTIDVRTPEAGILGELLVKEDDTVTPGQHVASIDAKASTGAAADTQSVPQQGQAQDATEPQPSVPERQAVAEGQGPQREEMARRIRRTPSIRFPPRRTETGQRISYLPAEERQKYMAQTGMGHGEAAPAQAPQPVLEPADGSARQALQQAALRPEKQRVPRRMALERGTKLSFTRVLTDREMEAIMLGGADP